MPPWRSCCARARELPAAFFELLELGLQHEQQHQELLATDIKYILSTSPLAPAYLEYLPGAGLLALPRSAAPPATWLPVPGGVHRIGFQEAGLLLR